MHVRIGSTEKVKMHVLNNTSSLRGFRSFSDSPCANLIRTASEITDELKMR
jgi:hypothetical protein